MFNEKEIIIPKNPPRLAIIIGPCRVGTTALANIFTKVGIISYMQPIKSARRAQEEGDKVIPWVIDEKKFVLSKETIGANTSSEFFDPIKILLTLGYLKEKLILISIVRDPRKVLPSWREMWGKVNLQKFAQSYELTQKIMKKAKNAGIKVIPYVHEVIRDNNPKVVIQSLFKQLGLKQQIINNTINWEKDDKFGEKNSKESKLKFYDVPPKKFIKEVKEWGSYQFREEPELRLSSDEAKFLKDNKKLRDIYEEFRLGCEESLGLKIKSYDSVNY